MLRYENYSLSPATWIEMLPSHWGYKKIGSLFTERRCKVSDQDYAPLSVSKMGVVPQLETAVKTDAGDNRKLVLSGDFVINSRSDRKGSCGISSLNGSVSLINIVLTPRDEWNSQYVHYLMRCHVFSEEYYRNGRGIVADLWTTRFSEMKNIILPIPPRTEQDQIVRYLDWKVSGINKLVADKKKQTALIQEYRSALINNAVTRGIRNAQEKSSGLNWLPCIPENWETIPAKALFDHIVEMRHNNDEMLAATQKYGMIAQKEYMELEGRRIVLANDNLEKWLHVEPDDFIISLRSFQGGLEVCTTPGCVTWHYVVLRPKSAVYVPYYKWLFKSASYIGALQRTSDFIRDGQDLRFSNFVKVRLLLVPMEEQKEIAEYLEKKVPLFDIAEKKISDEIIALQELKARLISDVVTGKMDVRNIIIPEYEYIAEESELAENESEDESDSENQED